MSFLANHVLLMAIYSCLTGAFFSLLWKVETRDRWRLFVQIAGGLFSVGLALAWIMYPFPLR